MSKTHNGSPVATDPDGLVAFVNLDGPRRRVLEREVVNNMKKNGWYDEDARIKKDETTLAEYTIYDDTLVIYYRPFPYANLKTINLEPTGNFFGDVHPYQNGGKSQYFLVVIKSSDKLEVSGDNRQSADAMEDLIKALLAKNLLVKRDAPIVGVPERRELLSNYGDEYFSFTVPTVVKKTWSNLALDTNMWSKYCRR